MRKNQRNLILSVALVGTVLASVASPASAAGLPTTDASHAIQGQVYDNGKDGSDRKKKKSNQEFVVIKLTDVVISG